MNFYETVLCACKRSGITITSLTQQLGISKANIRNWKDGVIPKFSVRLRIAQITGISLRDILTPEEFNSYNSMSKEQL